MCATKNWNDFSSSGEISKRAGGRRRYNAQRQAKALARRLAIVEMLGAQVILNSHGVQSILANRFGVNRSTICRDIKAILAEWRHHHICYDCWGYSAWAFGKQARLEKRLKRSMPDLGTTCCVIGFLRREAGRKKRRASKLELRFRQTLETL